MQAYSPILATAVVKNLYTEINNNLGTVLSQSSGTAFPTTNLFKGRPCFRTDTQKLYVCTDEVAPAWAELIDFTDGKVPNAELLDGLNGAQFLRSDVSATFTGSILTLDGATLYVDDDTATGARTRIVNDSSRTYFQAYQKDNTSIAKSIVFSGYGGADVGPFQVKDGGAYCDIWHEGNMGTGSGLDADTVDGTQESQFSRLDEVRTHTVSITTANAIAYRSKETGGTTREILSVTAANECAVGNPSLPLNIRGTTIEIDGNTVWHGGNDGAGSGLNADLLDGQQASAFAAAAHAHSGYITSNINDTVTAHTEWQDNYDVRLGNGADFRMRHDGTNNYMDLHLGNLYVRDATTTRFTFARTTGDFTATGNVTAYSDMRIKDDIKGIPEALQKISKLQGCTYKRTDIAVKERQAGLIAQDVEKVLPECVIETDDIKALNYNGVVALLVQGMNEVTKRLEALEA